MRLEQIKWLGLAMVLAGYIALPATARQGTPSEAAVEAMGLASIEVISDDEALAIRGLGYGSDDDSYAMAYGYSWAEVYTPIGSAGSHNGYVAVGRHHAGGVNYSEAGVEVSGPGGGYHDGHGPSNHGQSAHYDGKDGGGKHGHKDGGKYNGHGDKGGKHGHKGGGKHGGKHCGHGGKPQVKSIKVFAGGFSYASAK